MRPKKLVMENFGPYSGRVELDFSKLEDIFLITGKTGAGKTTIFDAICFALYGKVPGSRGEHPAKLHSDHAGEGSESFVSLEFRVGEKSYFARRSPRQERKKKRGEGTVTIEETLALFEIAANAEKSLGSKKSEGDAKLKEIIGLEAEEFFKVVLLPQGEFAEFLRQNTSERQKVLGKLFPVETAARVKDLARKKAADAEARAEGAARVLEEFGKKVSAETYNDAHAEAAAVLEKAAEKSLGFEQEENLFVSLLSLRRNEKDAEERLSESRRLFDAAVTAEVSINEKSVALSRSRAARPLEQYLRGAETADHAVKAAEAALVAAREEKAAAEEAADEAEKLNLETPVAEKEALALREKRPALVEILEDEEKLKAAALELEQQEAYAEKLSGKIKLLFEESEKQKVLMEETEKLSAEQPILEDKLELSKSIKDIFVMFRKYRERMDDIQKETLTAANEIDALERRAGEYEKNIPVLESEINRLREEQAARDRADMAASLSALLERGKPCPVCGSTEHPYPASGGELPFGFDERVRAQETALADARENRIVTSEKLEAKKREDQKTRDSLSALEAEIRETANQEFCRNALSARPDLGTFLESGAPLPSREIIARAIEAEARTLNEILERQKNCRNAAGRIKELTLRGTEIHGEQVEAEKSLAACGERQKNLAQRIAEGREKRRVLLASAAFARGEAHSSETSAEGDGQVFTDTADALASLDRVIAEKEHFITRLRRQREQSLLRLSAANAAWEGTSRNHGDATARLADARAALQAALSGTGFSRGEEAEQALLDPGVEQGLEREIGLWRENRASLETQTFEQEKQLEAIRRELLGLFEKRGLKSGFTSPPALGETEELLAKIKRERTAAEEEKTRAFAALNSLETDREALENAEKSYAALSDEARKFRTLSDDLSGKNPRKLPFDSWLLANYLEEAAAYATKRLEKMSEFRYSLLLDSARQQGRGYSGLDLMVFDSHTGKTRPCATLSGGESFMASISLALGLADSIQNRSGGVKLDTIFIDEGFGSLDDASLDKALVILDELRDRRMVGLISHVGEMRSRIPCRVEVIKTASGSRIEIP